MTGLPYYQQLKAFFDFKLENETNTQLISTDAQRFHEATQKYIIELTSIPLSAFVEYIIQRCKRLPIEAPDVFQFSNLDDATLNVCKAIHSTGNTGLTVQQIGRLLLHDGKTRSETAFNKYGENHIKTAEAFGLAFRANRREHYLSAVGMAYANLSDETRDKLLTRLVLRNKLMSQLILASYANVIELDAFLYDLSHSTYLRRRTNIKCMIGMLNETTEFDFSFLEKNIIL